MKAKNKKEKPKRRRDQAPVKKPPKEPEAKVEANQRVKLKI